MPRVRKYPGDTCLRSTPIRSSASDRGRPGIVITQGIPLTDNGAPWVRANDGYYSIRWNSKIWWGIINYSIYCNIKILCIF